MTGSISATQTAEERAERYKRLSRVPLPVAGEGAFVCFRLNDLCRFEEAIEKHFTGSGTIFAEMERLLLAGHAATFRAALDHGLKKAGPDDKPVPFTEIDLDDPGFTMADATPAILNAVAFTTYGKTYEELLSEALASQSE